MPVYYNQRKAKLGKKAVLDLKTRHIFNEKLEIVAQALLLFFKELEKIRKNDSIKAFSGVAQLVEQVAVNHWVGGSSPST